MTSQAFDTGIPSMQPPNMAIQSTETVRPADTRVFTMSCWALGLIVLLQFWIGAMALADRFHQAARPRIVEREVVRHVFVSPPGPSTNRTATPEIRSRPPVPASPATTAPTETRPSAIPEVLPVPTPLDAPPIADPRCERLVSEARETRVAGDMARTINKLEEALGISPMEPAVLFELGMIHEQMGIFDKAADYYQQVFELGTSGAGSLYQAAASKLRDGFANPADNIGKLSLGRVRIFQPVDKSSGETVILTIPVQKAPSFEADTDQIEVSVVFFNKTNKGEIIQLEEPSWVKEQWVSLPFDWLGGEEQLRMIYTIPPQDIQTEHLFGTRSYCGQVVTLRYHGEILDVQAWPRDLAGRLPAAPEHATQSELFPDFLDTPPPDFDGGVLPPIQE